MSSTSSDDDDTKKVQYWFDFYFSKKKYMTAFCNYAGCEILPSRTQGRDTNVETILKLYQNGDLCWEKEDALVTCYKTYQSFDDKDEPSIVDKCIDPIAIKFCRWAGRTSVFKSHPNGAFLDYYIEYLNGEKHTDKAYRCSSSN